MAEGEYVSVSSQSDTEEADLEREKGELATMPERELRELQGTYESRGLDPALAMRAALAAAATCSVGAGLPPVTAAVVPDGSVIPAVSALSLGFLAALG